MKALFVMRQHPAWRRCPSDVPSEELDALIDTLRQQRKSRCTFVARRKEGAGMSEYTAETCGMRFDWMFPHL